jgi:ADP-ribosylation factor related protein 1
LIDVVGKISLPSTTLNFFDLGGQRDIRRIWEKYYDECHAVVFVLDASDQARLSEGWGVFGKFSFPIRLPSGRKVSNTRLTQVILPIADEVLSSPRLLNLPLLLLANKQDTPTSLSPAEIRESFDAWHRVRSEEFENETSTDTGGDELGGSQKGERKRRVSDFDGAQAERMASLDVLGVSALTG